MTLKEAPCNTPGRKFEAAKSPCSIPIRQKPAFLAPFVAEPRLFRFTLRVTDVQGADSVPAVVDIMVEP